MMDAEPFRLRVLKAITEVIKGVSPGEGYTHDLSDEITEDGQVRLRVARGRVLFGSADPLPLVSILEDPRIAEGIYSPGPDGFRHGEWKLIVQGYVSDDHENPTDPAYLLAAEVAYALAQAVAADDGRNDIFDLGGGESDTSQVAAMEISPAVCRPPDEGISDVAYFYMIVTLTLAENRNSPFT